jgi:hypothetical protein
MPIVTNQLDQRLYTMCVAELTVLFASLFRLPPSSELVSIVRSMLLDGNTKKNTLSGFIDYVFLEQNKDDHNQWRIRVLLKETDYGEITATQSVRMLSRDAPTEPYVVSRHSHCWLLYPREIKCPEHEHQAENCMLCCSFGGAKAIFTDSRVQQISSSN